jgi:hypothetical protein
VNLRNVRYLAKLVGMLIAAGITIVLLSAFSTAQTPHHRARAHRHHVVHRKPKRLILVAPTTTTRPPPPTTTTTAPNPDLLDSAPAYVQAGFDCIRQHENGGSYEWGFPTGTGDGGGAYQFEPGTYAEATALADEPDSDITVVGQDNAAYAIWKVDGWSPWNGDGCF